MKRRQARLLVERDAGGGDRCIAGRAELAAVDDYVLARVPGLIAAGRLDDLLARAEAARVLFTQAAARMSVNREAS